MGIKLVDVLFLILSLIIVLLTAWLPVFVQSLLGKQIDDTVFKKKRITRGKSLMRPLNTLPQEMYGVIYPMYYMQLSGYFLAIVQATLIVVLISVGGLKEVSTIMILILTTIWLVQTIANIVTIMLTLMVSRKRVATRRADIAYRREENERQRKQRKAYIKKTRKEVKERELAKRQTIENRVNQEKK